MGRSRLIIALCAAPFLAACSNPLDSFERLSDVPLADDAVTAEIAAPAEETEAAPGLMQRLFSGIVEDRARASAETAEPVEELDLPVAAPRQGLWDRLGLGGLGAAPAAGVATPSPETTVPPGTLVPFGEIAQACGVRARNLGTQVMSASGYDVYDSNPTSTVARTHYVTGFADGCARQFTAALVLFGDIGTHELVRYSAADAGRAYSETDNAYEEIKGAFCGVPSGRPCGARLDRLARNTVFLTAYERFGSSPVWAEFLFSGGAVAAVGMEGN